MDQLTSSKNEFVMQDEVFFISYYDIVKTIYPALLQKIKSTRFDEFNKALKLDSIKELDDKNLLTLAYQRPHANMFEYLARHEFDYSLVETSLIDAFPSVFAESELLKIGHSIHLFMKEKFIKKIYIYTETYDKRVHFDIQNTYKNMDIVQYAYGNLTDVLDVLDTMPTTYFLNDIDYAIDLFSDKKYSEFTNIYFADYGYNYITDDEGVRDFRIDLEEYHNDIVCKLGTFTPIEFTEEHLSQLQ